MPPLHANCQAGRNLSGVSCAQQETRQAAAGFSKANLPSRPELAAAPALLDAAWHAHVVPDARARRHARAAWAGGRVRTRAASVEVRTGPLRPITTSVCWPPERPVRARRRSQHALDTVRPSGPTAPTAAPPRPAQKGRIGRSANDLPRRRHPNRDGARATAPRDMVHRCRGTPVRSGSAAILAVAPSACAVRLGGDRASVTAAAARRGRSILQSRRGGSCQRAALCAGAPVRIARGTHARKTAGRGGPALRPPWSPSSRARASASPCA
jgi:hypothetical protein